MDDIVIARVLHILTVVHWIGGVARETTGILPAVARLSDPIRRIELFETVEGNFSLQAKFSVTIAGLSGFYMTYRLDVWDPFSDPRFWWMPAMVLVWAVFRFRPVHCGTGFSARLVQRAARNAILREPSPWCIAPIGCC